MAKKPKQVAPSELEVARAQVQLTLWMRLQRMSRDLIYMTLMRGGGEPFGAPFEAGSPSLTERMVKRFRQRSFFRFETLERLEGRHRRNKYTRHGSAPYRGPYRHDIPVVASRGVVSKLLHYLRDNRFFIGSGPPAKRGGKAPKR